MPMSVLTFHVPFLFQLLFVFPGFSAVPIAHAGVFFICRETASGCDTV